MDRRADHFEGVGACASGDVTGGKRRKRTRNDLMRLTYLVSLLIEGRTRFCFVVLALRLVRVALLTKTNCGPKKRETKEG
jgi:hypothetical protein